MSDSLSYSKIKYGLINVVEEFGFPWRDIEISLSYGKDATWAEVRFRDEERAGKETVKLISDPPIRTESDLKQACETLRHRLQAKKSDQYTAPSSEPSSTDFKELSEFAQGLERNDYVELQGSLLRIIQDEASRTPHLFNRSSLYCVLADIEARRGEDASQYLDISAQTIRESIHIEDIAFILSAAAQIQHTSGHDAQSEQLLEELTRRIQETTAYSYAGIDQARCALAGSYTVTGQLDQVNLVVEQVSRGYWRARTHIELAELLHELDQPVEKINEALDKIKESGIYEKPYYSIQDILSQMGSLQARTGQPDAAKDVDSRIFALYTHTHPIGADHSNYFTAKIHLALGNESFVIKIAEGFDLNKFYGVKLLTRLALTQARRQEKEKSFETLERLKAVGSQVKGINPKFPYITSLLHTIAGELPQALQIAQDINTPHQRVTALAHILNKTVPDNYSFKGKTRDHILGIHNLT